MAFGHLGLRWPGRSPAGYEPVEELTQHEPARLPRVLGLSAAALLLAGAASLAHSVTRRTRHVPSLRQAWLQPQCAGVGENCWSSRCCKDAASTCFARREGWAECGFSCSSGEDPWSCAVLRPAEQCSPAGVNCTSTLCCADPLSICFYKDPGWASCRPQCEPGSIDPSEMPAFQTPWSCSLASIEPVGTAGAAAAAVWSSSTKLPLPSVSPTAGPSTAGPSTAGPSTAGQSTAGPQSSSTELPVPKRNPTTRPSTPRPTTVPKTSSTTRPSTPRPSTVPKTSSTTRPSTPRPSTAAPRASVAAPQSNCSSSYANCRETQCCVSPGARCFKHDELWSECRESCPDDASWECAQRSQKPEKPECSGFEANCAESQCCEDPAMRCFKRDEHYSECREACPPNSAGWACALHSVVRPPLLFCFALMLPFTQVELVRAQMHRKVGVFACDGFSIMSNSSVELSVLPYRVTTEVLPHFDTRLGSTVFAQVWDKIISDGRFLLYDWTVKLDPEAVFLPHRLRWHIMHWGWKPDDVVYLKGCGGGLRSAVQVISQGGMKVYSLGFKRCNGSMSQRNNFSEDDLFSRCMSLLGISAKDDSLLLRDKNCGTPSNATGLCNSEAAVFHPLKTTSEYFQCYSQALADAVEG